MLNQTLSGYLCTHGSHWPLLTKKRGNKRWKDTSSIGINQLFLWQQDNGEQFRLPVLSNYNRICTLSDDSNPLVCAWCLGKLGNLHGNLFNIFSLNIWKKVNKLVTEGERKKQYLYLNNWKLQPIRPYLPAMNPCKGSCFSLISKNIVHVATLRGQ